MGTNRHWRLSSGKIKRRSPGSAVRRMFKAGYTASKEQIEHEHNLRFYDALTNYGFPIEINTNHFILLK
jgi:hypothetical protein